MEKKTMIELSLDEKIALQGNPLLLNRYKSLIACYNSLTTLMPDLACILMMKKFDVQNAMAEVDKAFELKSVVDLCQYRPMSKYGDLMTIEEFEENLRDGCINRYDGSGYYAFADKVSDLHVNFDPDELDKDFTHVAWFNK